MAEDEQKIGRFLLDLDSANSLTARFDRFEKLVNELGFEGVSYTFLPRFDLDAIASKPPVFIKSNLFPDDFIDHYINGGLSQFDFTVRKIGTGNYTPMIWQDHERQKRISVDEANVIKIAREDYRITNALTIPTMPELTRTLGIAGVSLLTSEKDEKFKKLLENIDTLAACARQFHAASYTSLDIHKHFIWSAFDKLSDNQRDLIVRLVNGETIQQIAFRRSRTDSAIYSMLDRIRKEKFGGITTKELIDLIKVSKYLQAI